ncbi:hypothetical protein ES708_09823 [subsurface metagenome]
MPAYKCLNCRQVVCGWAVKYKLRYKCSDCGGELREIPFNNKKYRKAVRDHKRNSVSLVK